MAISKKNNSLLKKYVINISVLTSVTILIIASLFNEYMSVLLRGVIDPLFSKDLNHNNDPDLYYVNNINAYIFGTKFPIGNLVYNTMMFIIKIIVLFFVLKFLLNNINIS